MTNNYHRYCSHCLVAVVPLLYVKSSYHDIVVKIVLKLAYWY